jgi:hypothetical protein
MREEEKKRREKQRANRMIKYGNSKSQKGRCSNWLVLVFYGMPTLPRVFPSFFLSFLFIFYS